MNLENQLRETLQAKGEELVPTPELKVKIMSNHTSTKGSFKRRMISSVLVAMLVIPTSAFAYQSLSADGLYGSFENLKKFIPTATMKGYLMLSAKLDQAQGELGKEEYKHFVEILNVVTSAKMEYGDPNGNIDYDKVPEETRTQIKDGLMAIQPYFDKLNGQLSSKEVLSEAEYEQYIMALMTYEKIIVQSELNPSKDSIEADMVLPHLQADFMEAQDFLSYVDDRQTQAQAEEFEREGAILSY